MKKSEIEAQMNEAARNILSDQEAATIAAGAVIGHGGEATHDEILAVMNWAVEARMDAAALDMALTGQIVVSTQDGKIAYRLATPQERAIVLRASAD